MLENLIKTPSVDEAIAYLEAFLFGNEAHKLYIIGPPGCGKSFLAQWAAQQTQNGKRGAIFDEQEPDSELPFWVCFQTSAPEGTCEDQIVRIGAPEYERKHGVLDEWAGARNLNWQPKALEALLRIQTDNLQLLRSLAQRIAVESGIISNVISEVDVLRTLARVGYLQETLADAPSGTAPKKSPIQ